MREYLFKANRIDNSREVEGSLIILKDKSFIFIETKPSKVKSLSHTAHKLIVECVEVIPETVRQFTGLCDKNGKKIFEGDIVRIQSFDEMTDKYQNQKEFDKHKKRLIKDYGCIFDTETKHHTNYDYIVEWELNGFYPFCDSPENCRHCGGAEDNSKCEIIGNMHDNKSLLEVEE